MSAHTPPSAGFHRGLRLPPSPCPVEPLQGIDRVLAAIDALQAILVVLRPTPNSRTLALVHHWQRRVGSVPR